VADSNADLGECPRCGLAGLGNFHGGSPLFPSNLVRLWCGSGAMHGGSRSLPRESEPVATTDLPISGMDRGM
jgi:hypothetical protein